MATASFVGQEIEVGAKRLPTPWVKINIVWPEGCQRLDFARPDIVSEATVALQVKRNTVPLSVGQICRLIVTVAEARFSLILLPIQIDRIEDGADSFHRNQIWSCHIVGFSSDPLALLPSTPKPTPKAAGSHLGTPAGIDLAEFMAFLRAGVGDLPAAKFTSEGGFKV